MNTSTKTLDRLDMRILSLIQSDGRITNKELSEQVNLSPSACHQRLQRLISEEWIQGFIGVLNIERLCAPVQCIATLKLDNHSPDSFRFLERRVESLPEVLEAYTVSGTCDFIARFACAHMSRYMMLTNNLMQDCPEITHISTHVIMKTSKAYRGYPIKELVETK